MSEIHSGRLGKFMEAHSVQPEIKDGQEPVEGYKEKLRQMGSEDLMLFEDLLRRADSEASMRALDRNLEGMSEQSRREHQGILTWAHMVGSEGMGHNPKLTEALREIMKEKGADPQSVRNERYKAMDVKALIKKSREMEREASHLWANLPPGGQERFDTLEAYKQEMVASEAHRAFNIWLDKARKPYDELSRAELTQQRSELAERMEAERAKHRKPDGLYDIKGPWMDELQEMTDELYLIDTSLASIYRKD